MSVISLNTFSRGSATAALDASAMTGVSGNAGVNIAAGVSNVQFNGLVVH
ncbi:hypothetical protein [Paraburkholderia ultramafica]|nr:hypothetical protein [Paraburkholderia ultramafica]